MRPKLNLPKKILSLRSSTIVDEWAIGNSVPKPIISLLTVVLLLYMYMNYELIKIILIFFHHKMFQLLMNSYVMVKSLGLFRLDKEGFVV